LEYDLIIKGGNTVIIVRNEKAAVAPNKQQSFGDHRRDQLLKKCGDHLVCVKNSGPLWLTKRLAISISIHDFESQVGSLERCF